MVCILTLWYVLIIGSIASAICACIRQCSVSFSVCVSLIFTVMLPTRRPADLHCCSLQNDKDYELHDDFAKKCIFTYCYGENIYRVICMLIHKMQSMWKIFARPNVFLSLCVYAIVYRFHVQNESEVKSCWYFFFSFSFSLSFWMCLCCLFFHYCCFDFCCCCNSVFGYATNYWKVIPMLK